jgi:putative spermidine/putrescine transport system permease protein
VAVAGLFAFLISWGQYVLMFLLGGGNVVTLIMLLFCAASRNNPVVTSALAIALRYLTPSSVSEGRGFVGLGKVS